MLSKKLIFLSLIFILSTVILLGFGPLLEEPGHAQDPDLACRTCHSKNEQEITLPSGETLSLLVLPEILDASPHSSTSNVSCSDCHRPRINYQYPHPPATFETRRELALSISERCEKCHYPHRPLHASEEVNPDFPACVDCHGSHQIDDADNVLNSMPEACVACHTDQTPDWAADYVAPRPGVGQAAEGYVGSDRCAGCHDEKYFSWRNTLHAKIVQNPVDNPEAVVGDFNLIDPDRTFELDDADYIMGSRWKQQYLTRNEDGNIYVLPAQWNVETQEWVAYNPDTWQDIEWRENCSFCHVTGLSTESWGFEEFGVGCEACHGPGAEHVDDPENVKPFAQVDDQVCGSCHSQGTSPEGHPFPATYRPGDTLTDHFTFTTDDHRVWPDGSAKGNAQQYMDWKLGGSSMALSVQTSCTTCHNVHDNGIGQTQLHTPLNDLCLECHTDKKAIIDHTPFHDKAITKHNFTCADCHMPKMATSAVPYDIHNHNFKEPNPQASIEYGGVEVMLNACNTCHTSFSETPQWAAETIAYVKAVAPPRSAAIEVGPTPTSPPPPTPVPSVGQPPVIQKAPVETGVWIRYSFFIVVGLFAAAIIYVIVRSIIKSRSATNV